MCIFECMCMCVCVFACIRVYVHTYMHIRTYICMYACVCNILVFDMFIMYIRISSMLSYRKMTRGSSRGTLRLQRWRITSTRPSCLKLCRCGKQCACILPALCTACSVMFEVCGVIRRGVMELPHHGNNGWGERNVPNSTFIETVTLSCY